MGFCIGLDAVLRYGTRNTTPATTLQNVQDVTLSGDNDTIERVRRGIRWKGKTPTTQTFNVDVQLLYDPTDAGFLAIKNANFAANKDDKIIALAILDDQGHGLVADFVVESFSREEPAEGDLTVSVTFALCTDYRNPTWV